MNISGFNLLEKIKKSPLVLVLWYLNGSQVPPPHIVKQRAVASYGKIYNIGTLIESGTYKGDMVFGMKNKYKKVITIELSDIYYKLAVQRFKKDKNITLIKGDSGKSIKKILKSINKPCVFWLDGHYSSGNTAKGLLNTPVIQELNSILKHKIKNHVILIDDARHFTGHNDYPKIDDLKKILSGTKYAIEVKDDIIRITSKN